MPDPAGGRASANDATVDTAAASGAPLDKEEARKGWRLLFKAGDTREPFDEWYWATFPASLDDASEREHRLRRRRSSVVQTRQVLADLEGAEESVEAKYGRAMKARDAELKEAKKMVAAAEKAVKAAEKALKEAEG